MKKTLAILLSLALAICMIPATAFAGETALTADKVSFDKSASELYSGSNSLPNVTLEGSTAQDGVSITWSKGGSTVSNSTNLDAGVYTATVTTTGNGNYVAGSVTKDFAVVAINPNNVTITYSGSTAKESFSGFDAAEIGDSISGSEITTSKITAKQGNYTVDQSRYTVSAKKLSATQIRVYANFTANGDNVTATASAFYDFSVTTTLSNEKYDIIGTGTDGTIPQQEYNGGTALTPTVYVVPEGEKTTAHALKAGIDYTLSYSNNTQGNKTATVTATGINGYAGYVTANFDIKGKDVNRVTVTPQNTVQGQKPAFTVKDGTTVLAEGTDYTVQSWDSNTVGTNKGTAVIKGNGNYAETKTVYFTVIASGNTFGQGEVSYTLTNTPYYNGSYQYADITVKIGTNPALRKDYDYKVEYTYTDKNGKTVVTSNPKDAGTYYFTVTGIGSYAGTATGSFIIQPVPLDWAEIVLGSSTTLYNGVYVPTVSVRHIGGKFYFDASDYTVTYKNVNSSYYYAKPTAVVTPKTGGNLAATSTVKTLEKEFSLASRNLSNCTVTFTDSRSSKNYDGNESFKPPVTVKDYSINKTLTENLDYKITYKDAAGKVVYALKDAGTYSVIVEGINAYTGTKTLTFTINGTDISGYTVTLKESSVNATGYAQTPVITSVKKGYYSSLSSNDYTVSYQDATGKTVYSMSAPGTYKVVVTGKNGYSGSTYATFRIVGLPQTVTVNQDSYKVYTTSDSFKITAKATGDGTGFTYTSSNPAVASVSSTGYVTIHKVGKAVITVTTTGNKKYEPTSKDVTVKVYPKKTVLAKKPWTDGKKAQLKVRWNYQDGATKYQIRYSRDKNFKAGTYLTKTVKAHGKDYTTQSTTLTKLKSGYTYYVKVRAVYTDPVTGDNYYGSWSGWRSAKTI